jgi:hypothetical protein
MVAIIDGRKRRRAARRRERLRRARMFGVASVLVETGAVWRRAGRPGGRLVVRCRRGHLYTTIWVPAVSVKSLRLGWWRLQYCPVGRHWSLVAPVRESDLTEQELLTARANRDIRIP